MKESKKEVTLTNESIKRNLKGYDAYQAIIEYIWNGIDAKGNLIEVFFSKNELGRIVEIKIVDNGEGIAFEELGNKFKTFNVSDKENQKNKSDIHGKNGVGRFTFFVLGYEAIWNTTYKLQGKLKKYTITIKEKELNSYVVTEPTESKDDNTGTTVTIRVKDNIIIKEEEFKERLKEKFIRFLEVKDFINIKINNIDFDYKDKILFTQKFEKEIKENKKFKFDIKFNIYKENISDESKYCFVNNLNEVQYINSAYNRKNSKFKHQVIIKSTFFDEFKILEDSTKKDEPLFEKDQLYKKVYNTLLLIIKDFLFNERKKFLKKESAELIVSFKKDKVFPEYGTEPWEKFREKETINFVEELYIYEPKIFTKLNLTQKRTIIRLFDLILSSSERDSLFKILESLVELEQEERDDLKKLLEKSSLQNIIETMKMIEDRYRAVEHLKKLVFNDDLKTYEVKHIQKVIESHFWIFGEEFNLVTSAEPSFKTALKKYWEDVIRDDLIGTVEHPDALKEMDIFLCQRDVKNDKIRNIVVELKRPNIKIGVKQYRQIEDYKEVILSTPQFNGHNEEWIFILIGREFDNSNFIERKYENAKSNGEKFLTDKGINYKIYVKKWSEIISEFEMKHNFLNKKLSLQRDELINEVNEIQDADQLTNNAILLNSASILPL
ncbi:ATP-binding protein [Fusobacterium sp. THCT1E2]